MAKKKEKRLSKSGMAATAKSVAATVDPLSEYDLWISSMSPLHREQTKKIPKEKLIRKRK